MILTTDETRASIFDCLNALYSKSGKLEFLGKVEKQVKRVEGAWPANASKQSAPVLTKLAKLDEKWLNLS